MKNALKTIAFSAIAIVSHVASATAGSQNPGVWKGELYGNSEVVLYEQFEMNEWAELTFAVEGSDVDLWVYYPGSKEADLKFTSSFDDGTIEEFGFRPKKAGRYKLRIENMGKDKKKAKYWLATN